MKKEKTALILSGGGMKASFSAGALYGLVHFYKIKDPDIVIGGSGGAGSAAYFVSKQISSLENGWVNLLSTRKFINPLRITKMLDIDYLIDDVFKKQDPLNMKNIFSSKILFMIPTTNAKTGEIEYFSNKKKQNLWKALKATKAIPLVYGKEIKIGNKEYIDTDNSCEIEPNIRKAVELGAKKIIVIDVYPNKHAFLINLGLEAWLNTKTSLFRKNYWRFRERREVSKIPDGIKVFYIRPNRKLKVGLLDNERNLLGKTFKQGYNQVIKDRKLKKFLKNY